MPLSNNLNLIANSNGNTGDTSYNNYKITNLSNGTNPTDGVNLS